MTIFEQLEEWLSKNHTRFEEEGISARFIQCQPTDNTAANIDIDTETIVARVTLWESMEMNFEAMEIGGDEFLIWETHQIENMQEALHLLEDFSARLREHINTSPA